MWPDYLDDVLRPRTSAKAEIFRDRLGAVVMDLFQPGFGGQRQMCAATELREQLVESTNQHMQWCNSVGLAFRETFELAFKKAFELRLMLENSPAEYCFDFPACLEDFDQAHMDAVESEWYREGKIVCMCLQPAIFAKTRAVETGERSVPRKPMVAARVLLL